MDLEPGLPKGRLRATEGLLKISMCFIDAINMMTTAMMTMLVDTYVNSRRLGVHDTMVDG